MPRRAGPSDDKFLRANLNDPDNQAALLRAYLELKQTVENLSDKLTRADQQLVESRSSQEQAVREASDAGQRELQARTARLERLSEAMKLVRWAAEWAARDATFLVGSRHGLSEVVTLATENAEACRQVRYDKSRDAWVLSWADGRPETVVAVSPPKEGREASVGAGAAEQAKRRRPVARH